MEAQKKEGDRNLDKLLQNITRHFIKIKNLREQKRYEQALAQARRMSDEEKFRVLSIQDRDEREQALKKIPYKKLSMELMGAAVLEIAFAGAGAVIVLKEFLTNFADELAADKIFIAVLYAITLPFFLFIFFTNRYVNDTLQARRVEEILRKEETEIHPKNS